MRFRYGYVMIFVSIENPPKIPLKIIIQVAIL